MSRVSGVRLGYAVIDLEEKRLVSAARGPDGRSYVDDITAHWQREVRYQQDQNQWNYAWYVDSALYKLRNGWGAP